MASNFLQNPPSNMLRLLRLPTLHRCWILLPRAIILNSMHLGQFKVSPLIFYIEPLQGKLWNICKILKQMTPWQLYLLTVRTICHLVYCVTRVHLWVLFLLYIHTLELWVYARAVATAAGEQWWWALLFVSMGRTVDSKQFLAISIGSFIYVASMSRFRPRQREGTRIMRKALLNKPLERLFRGPVSSLDPVLQLILMQMVLLILTQVLFVQVEIHYTHFVHALDYLSECSVLIIARDLFLFIFYFYILCIFKLLLLLYLISKLN